MLHHQKENKNARTIVIAPGPDGFGPSVIGSYVCHALGQALQRQGIDCRFVVYTAHRAFNENLLRELPDVTVRECPHGIRLAKGAGGVDRLGTRRMVLRYLDDVSDCLSSCCVLDGADLVVSIGAPHIVFAASWKCIPVVEVFDHSWAETLAAILLEGGSYDAQSAAVVNAIRDFEQHADRVYLLPEFIAPTPFVQHWLSTAPGRVERLTGILGPRRTHRIEAIARLPLQSTAPLVVLTGGGTGVWDTLMQAVFAELQRKGRASFNVILPYPEDQSAFAHVTSNGDSGKIPRSNYGSLRELLAEADLVVSRPGAGIVMDAIACRTPLLALPETGHPQVEAIRHSLVKQRFALSPVQKAFDSTPASRDTMWAQEAARELLDALDNLFRQESEVEALQAMIARLATVPTEQETWIAHDIIERFNLASRISDEVEEMQLPYAA